MECTQPKQQQRTQKGGLEDWVEHSRDPAIHKEVEREEGIYERKDATNFKMVLTAQNSRTFQGQFLISQGLKMTEVGSANLSTDRLSNIQEWEHCTYHCKAAKVAKEMTSTFEIENYNIH